jgi:hypothetical protein
LTIGTEEWRAEWDTPEGDGSSIPSSGGGSIEKGRQKVGEVGPVVHWNAESDSRKQNGAFRERHQGELGGSPVVDAHVSRQTPNVSEMIDSNDVRLDMHWDRSVGGMREVEKRWRL